MKRWYNTHKPINVIYHIKKMKDRSGEDGSKEVGVEPSSPCDHLEYLANFLRNRVNSHWNPSLYEVWRQKIAGHLKTDKEEIALGW